MEEVYSRDLNIGYLARRKKGEGGTYGFLITTEDSLEASCLVETDCRKGQIIDQQISFIACECKVFSPFFFSPLLSKGSQQTHICDNP